MRFLYLALFCLALFPAGVFSQNPAPYGIQAAPKPKIVGAPAVITKPEKGRYGFIFLGEADGSFVVARLKSNSKENPKVILPFSPIPKELIFDYDIDIYDKKFNLIRTFPIKFKTDRPLRESFSIISNTIHVLYTAQQKNKNLLLYKDVYTIEGIKLIDGEVLDELNTDGKNTERSKVYLGRGLLAMIQILATKVDRGLKDGVFYWNFTPSQEKLLLYKQDLQTNKINFRFSSYDTKLNYWNYSLDLSKIMEKASVNEVSVNDEGIVMIEISGQCKDEKGKSCLQYYFLNGETQKLTEIDFGLSEKLLVYETNMLIDEASNFLFSCFTNKNKKDKLKTDWPTQEILSIKFNSKTGDKVYSKLTPVSRIYETTYEKPNETYPLEFIYQKELPNGNVLFISHKFLSETSTTMYQGSGGSMQTNSTTYYNFNDIIVQCLDKNGNQLYSSKIRRNTISAIVYDTYIPIIMERDGHVTVIFNELDAAQPYFDSGSTEKMKKSQVYPDYSMKNTQLVAVVVDNKGKVGKRIVLRDNDATRDYLDPSTIVDGFSYVDVLNQENLVGFLKPFPKLFKFTANVTPVGAIQIQF